MQSVLCRIWCSSLKVQPPGANLCPMKPYKIWPEALGLQDNSFGGQNEPATPLYGYFVWSVIPLGLHTRDQHFGSRSILWQSTRSDRRAPEPEGCLSSLSLWVVFRLSPKRVTSLA